MDGAKANIVGPETGSGLVDARLEASLENVEVPVGGPVTLICPNVSPQVRGDHPFHKVGDHASFGAGGGRSLDHDVGFVRPNFDRKAVIERWRFFLTESRGIIFGVDGAPGFTWWKRGETGRGEVGYGTLVFGGIVGCRRFGLSHLRGLPSERNGKKW